MEFKKFMSLGIKTEEGVTLTKYLIAIHKAEEASVIKVKNLFETHGYNISVVPGEFLKIFTMNEKEIAELGKALDKIEELGLKDIFNANLKISTFKPALISRAEFCLNNNIPFLNSDNSIVSMLYNTEAFAEYTTRPNDVKTVREIEENPSVFDENKNITMLDEEDLMVQKDIIKTLTEINRENPNDTTLTFIVTTIIANLDGVLANDNKNYRFMGTEHIIENALQGFALTPEMEEIAKNKIMNRFTNSNEVEFGRLA